jgi:hypothetical protein
MKNISFIILLLLCPICVVKAQNTRIAPSESPKLLFAQKEIQATKHDFAIELIANPQEVIKICAEQKLPPLSI